MALSVGRVEVSFSATFALSLSPTGGYSLTASVSATLGITGGTTELLAPTSYGPASIAYSGSTLFASSRFSFNLCDKFGIGDYGVSMGYGGTTYFNTNVRDILGSKCSVSFSLPTF